MHPEGNEWPWSTVNQLYESQTQSCSCRGLSAAMIDDGRQEGESPHSGAPCNPCFILFLFFFSGVWFQNWPIKMLKRKQWQTAGWCWRGNEPWNARARPGNAFPLQNYKKWTVPGEIIKILVVHTVTYNTNKAIVNAVQWRPTWRNLNLLNSWLIYLWLNW